MRRFAVVNLRPRLPATYYYTELAFARLPSVHGIYLIEAHLCTVWQLPASFNEPVYKPIIDEKHMRTHR